VSLTLQSLVERGIGARVVGDASVRISGVQHDSRQVGAGDLFVAIPGAKLDGAAFVKSAIERGAAAIASEQPLEAPVPVVEVASARRALSLAAHAVYGEPTRAVRTIGITGTNGKTTTTWIVDEALTSLGRKPALVGTVETRGLGHREASAFTTPEGDDLARFARRMVDGGATDLVMEVSSHALTLFRAEGITFEVAAFTNLTQDHLDFHGTMEAYLEAKARLFFDLAPASAVINVDDAAGVALAKRIDRAVTRLFTVSRTSTRADVYAKSYTLGREGVVAPIVCPRGALTIESRMVGAHNLDNLLLAAGCLCALGLDVRDIERALGRVVGAPGRLERVEDPRDVATFVDYAHSPDALAKALDALRPITPGRLIVVFGCGGDRDRGKRPIMGAAAGERADLVVVTSDNPRTEDPASIVDAIVPGVAKSLTRVDTIAGVDRGYTVEVDRRAAIGLALSAATAGDTVLIAGKGHEDYQILGTTKIHFDDREEARNAIATARREAS
jgi:UDP-N-acetylmuramoyl-L-alanyl-D-glutamate--2,6-diaminopimelate ligase